MYPKLRKIYENEKLFSRKRVFGFRENEKHFSFFVRLDFLFFAVFRFRDLKNICFSPFFVFKKIEVLRFRRFSISRKFRKMKNFFLKKVFRATPVLANAVQTAKLPSLSAARAPAILWRAPMYCTNASYDDPAGSLALVLFTDDIRATFRFKTKKGTI